MVRVKGGRKTVIDFFEKHPRRKFYLRELARELVVDPGNLSRILSFLIKEEKLLKTKKGNLVYFSLAREEASRAKGLDLLDDSDVNKYLKNTEPDLVKLVQSLARTPSVSGEDPEEKIAQFIFDKARIMGLIPQIVAKDKKRPNMVIDVEKNSDISKPYFLLIGHMDTIGIGDIDNWRYYPFSGHTSGGRIYGRGTADMKAGIACEMYTLKLIKDLNIELPVLPRILLVSNEEGGSTATPIFDLGMEHLIAEGFVKGNAAIYGYGGTYNIGIGHRGVLRVKITTQGEAVHTGSVKWQKKEKGINAVTAMSEILLELENIELPEVTHPSFTKHGNVITPGTMILHGGTAVSTVPDFCESVVEVRYLPGLKIRKIYHEIKEVAEKIAERRGVKAELERFVNISAVSLSPKDKIVQVVSSACRKVYGKKVTTRGTGPANESFMLIKRGIPTVVFGPLGGKAHADNEFVYVNSLVKTVKVYLQTMANFG